MNKWYSIVESSDKLEQGDLIDNCSVIIPPLVMDENADIAIEEFDIIVLSQSCDLENNKIKTALVCPVISLHEYDSQYSNLNAKELTKNKEAIRKGHQHSLHLLDKCNLEKFISDYKFVEFKNTFSINLKYLKNHAKSQKQRLRLNSPYKEHLSQAFARFFMRVGLPTDIPEFK